MILRYIQQETKFILLTELKETYLSEGGYIAQEHKKTGA